MFTIQQCKQLKDTFVIDEVRGILDSVQDHKQVTTARGLATVQNFKLQDPAGRDFIMGAIWDHQPLNGLVGTEIILVSIKANNGKFGGISIHDKQDNKDPSKIYKNLSVSAVGVVHTPDTYQAAFQKAPAAGTPSIPVQTAPQQAAVPATVPRATPQPANAPPAGTMVMKEGIQAPVPTVPPRTSAAPRGANQLRQTHEGMVEYYDLCFQAALRILFVESEVKLSAAELQVVVAATATLFIEGCDHGFHCAIPAPRSAPSSVAPDDDVPF